MTIKILISPNLNERNDQFANFHDFDVVSSVEVLVFFKSLRVYFLNNVWI